MLSEPSCYIDNRKFIFWKITSPNDDGIARIGHIDALFSYAMVLTRNRSEAEDLV
jgi:hypothetical protein